jgi:putative nucleotidyltransferase-like protein
VKDSALRGSFWPTPTQEALLRITLGPAAEAAARWSELQPIDIQALEPGSFCLLPLLYERLSEVAPTDHRLTLLRGTCRSNWLRNQLLIERVADLVPRLRALGIEPLVIGGAAIITRWYSDLGSRPLPQFELAVDPRRGAAAAGAAEAEGWRSTGGDGVHRWFVDRNGLRLVLHEGMPPLVSGPLGRAGALRELRARAGSLSMLDTSMLALQPADELMIACGLGARTTIPPTIQWLLDVAAVLAAPDRPRPHELLARARRYSLVEPVRDTIAYLARFADVELDGYLAALAAEPVSRREMVAYRMSGLRAGAFVGLPLVLASGLRGTSELPASRALAGLPRQAQEAWGATSLRQTTAFAVRKLGRLAKRQRQRQAPPRQSVSGSAAGRNRSASS